MTAKRVIFIRPGETDWNLQERWQGWVASPLNEYGKRQAWALAKYIRNIGMDVLYSSDLRRAVDTANIFAENLQFDPILDRRLREQCIGEWQGLTLREIKEWYPEQFKQLRNDPMNYAPVNAESELDVQKRIVEFFNEVTEIHSGKTVGVITHTTAIDALFSSLLLDYEPLQHKYGNTSVTTIERTGDHKWRIVTANDISHLEGLEARYAREFKDEQ